MKEIEKVSSGKVKYDSLTGKSVINPTISRFRPYMNKILGITRMDPAQILTGSDHNPKNFDRCKQGRKFF